MTSISVPYPVDLYHATFLTEKEYFVDILDRFKVFEVSLHRLLSPKPRALFRGSAPVREAGFFFNIETILHPPLGPFHTASAIRFAAISYLQTHRISPPTLRRKYVPLPGHMINSNKECRLNASLDPSQKMAIMIRPSFKWYACEPFPQVWDGLGLSSSLLAQVVCKATRGVYLYPLSEASESSILWKDSVGNQCGWMTHEYNHNTRISRAGPVVSTEKRVLFYRPSV